ncbi:hypothetical protein BGZ61DRAFT_474659 [Ilyonectria robusta]|uniref:uncharacterized protein n=1 Tax=Ilyonectria robusta TaxID=1079257 RepID=UPI001E8CB5D9|nr:uncharacterized protein BGZ61DRAFT_474659 [Ilyonectria robusta]KAH8734042.1 hypothetical protein BGZ61DRAFT_474659 [Ilyonectria robusta]
MASDCSLASATAKLDFPRDGALCTTFWPGVPASTGAQRWAHLLDDDDDPRRAHIRRAALGFLRSYYYIIQYESDLRIAQDPSLCLVPAAFNWEQFCAFTSNLANIPDDQVSPSADLNSSIKSSISSKSSKLTAQYISSKLRPGGHNRQNHDVPTFSPDTDPELTPYKWIASPAINTLGYIESTILPLPDRDLHCSLRRPDPLDHTPHASDLPYTPRLDPTVTRCIAPNFRT